MFKLKRRLFLKLIFDFNNAWVSLALSYCHMHLLIYFWDILQFIIFDWNFEIFNYATEGIAKQCVIFFNTDQMFISFC